jgi:DNA-binding response OmpR family regulator
MKDTNIIIVDDDSDLAESLAELLEVNGYQVEIASNGQEAVECFRHKDYDIAFMDVRMPVMNGVDSFLAIRQEKPAAKVVMMTGLRGSAAKALEAGALGLLEKPFGFEAMLAFVETRL